MNKVFIKMLKQIARVCENNDKNVVLKFVYLCTNTEIHNNRNNGNNKSS